MVNWKKGVILQNSSLVSVHHTYEFYAEPEAAVRKRQKTLQQLLSFF